MLRFVPLSPAQELQERFQPCACQQHGGRHLVVVEMGYSQDNESCAVLQCAPMQPIPDLGVFTFADAITETATALAAAPDPLLIIEAPLSAFHVAGNPRPRPLERTPGTTYGWYYNSGGSMALAAQRFMTQVDLRLMALAPTKQVLSVEAFAPTKPVLNLPPAAPAGVNRDEEVARRVHTGRTAAVAHFDPEWTPLAPLLITGAPVVWAFA